MTEKKQIPAANVEFVKPSSWGANATYEQMRHSQSDEMSTLAIEHSESQERIPSDASQADEQDTPSNPVLNSNFAPASRGLTTLFSKGETTQITSKETDSYIVPTNGWLTQLQRANVEFLAGTAPQTPASPPTVKEDPPLRGLSPPTVIDANTARAPQDTVLARRDSNEGDSSHQLLGDTDSTQSMSSLYTALEHLPKAVRLLRIEAGPKNASPDEVHCLLSIAQPWHHPVSYDCLSYCWGNTKAKSKVLIRTPESQYCAVIVTANLYAALRSLRNTHASKYLWIDALSINQSDLRERASQVSIMKDIYNMASCITVWLGESTTGLSSAIASISTISKTFDADIPGIGNITGPSGLQVTAADIKRLGSYNGEMAKYAYEALGELFSLPYFRRVWVLQEVTAHTAVTVRVGEHSLPWSSVILAALWQSSYTRSYTATVSSRSGGTDTQGYLPELWLGLLHTRPERGLSMVELVSRARTFEATDPRDKVFAMLGLANDIGDGESRLRGLTPDYTLTKEETYCNFAKDYIATTMSLDILSTVDTFSTARPEEKPSWMPDLELPIATIRGFGFPRKYSASLSTAVDPTQIRSEPEDNSVLSLRGFTTNTVRSISQDIILFSRDLKVHLSDGADAITTLWKDVQTSQLQYSGEELLRRYIKLLTAAGFALPAEFPIYPLGRVVPPREVPSLIADFAAYWKRIDPSFNDFEANLRTPLAKQVRDGDADQFGVLVGKACHERKLFATADGRMGLCPRDTEVGDSIVILYGGSVPYVLREVGAGAWRFVGECYADGIMFGEAVERRGVEQLYCII